MGVQGAACCTAPLTKSLLTNMTRYSARTRMFASSAACWLGGIGGACPPATYVQYILPIGVSFATE